MRQKRVRIVMGDAGDSVGRVGYVYGSEEYLRDLREACEAALLGENPPPSGPMLVQYTGEESTEGDLMIEGIRTIGEIEEA